MPPVVLHVSVPVLAVVALSAVVASRASGMLDPCGPERLLSSRTVLLQGRPTGRTGILAWRLDDGERCSSGYDVWSVDTLLRGPGAWKRGQDVRVFGFDPRGECVRSRDYRRMGLSVAPIVPFWSSPMAWRSDSAGTESRVLVATAWAGRGLVQVAVGSTESLAGRDRLLAVHDSLDSLAGGGKGAGR